MLDRIRSSFRRTKNGPNLQDKAPEIDLIKRRLFKICPLDEKPTRSLAVVPHNSDISLELNARGTNFFFRYDCICPEEYPQLALTLTESGLITLEPFDITTNQVI